MMYDGQMKGITNELRNLAVGEHLKDIITDMERSDLHRIAKRVGIKVSCKRFEGGFLVTRVK